MGLGARLKAAAELVPECTIAADIGCDHGKLAAWLVKSGRVSRAIACDISAASLKKAEALGCETRLGDGLEPLAPGEAQAVIIAGMGGELIGDILARGKNKLMGASLVMMPAQQLETLRAYLRSNGFCIERETLVSSNGKWYCAMLAREGVTQACVEAYIHDIAGPVLWKERPPELVEYLLWLLTSVDKALAKVSGNTENADFARGRLARRRQMLEEMLHEIRVQN